MKHTITRYWITLEAYRVRVESRPHYGERSARWVKPKQLNVYAFPSAHKHLVRALLKAGD